MSNPNRTVSMIECLLARGQNNFLRRRKRFEFSHSLGQDQSSERANMVRFTAQ
jgi:hypothetical protein